MISGQEIINSLKGSWRLFLHDDRGLEKFTFSTGGFWRSFLAIVLIAPAHIFAMSVTPQQETAETARNVSVALSIFTLLLQWFFWPAAMAFISKLLGYGKHYVRYVVVYNWSEVLIMVIMVLPIVASYFQMTDTRGASMATFYLFVLTRYLRWHLNRVTLETSGLISAALVLADVVTGLGIAKLTGVL